MEPMTYAVAGGLGSQDTKSWRINIPQLGPVFLAGVDPVAGDADEFYKILNPRRTVALWSFRRAAARSRTSLKDPNRTRTLQRHTLDGFSRQGPGGDRRVEVRLIRVEAAEQIKATIAVHVYGRTAVCEAVCFTAVFAERQ
jgi:hypothetical protein